MKATIVAAMQQQRDEDGLVPKHGLAATVSTSTTLRSCLAVEMDAKNSISHAHITRAEHRMVSGASRRFIYANAVVACAAGFYSSDSPLTADELARRTPTHVWVSSVHGEDKNMRPIRFELMLGIDDMSAAVWSRPLSNELEWSAVDTSVKDDKYSYWVAEEEDGG